MRRRFGRRRWRGGNGGESGSARPPVDPAALARIGESGVAGAARLEPIRYDDVPEWLCALGTGEAPGGQNVLASYAPGGGVAALLGAVVASARLASEPGARWRVVALAPTWREIDRRFLGLLASLPFEITALTAPVLSDDGAIEAEPHSPALAGPPELVGAALVSSSERARFERALSGLRGLAAKHGGVVRGGDGAAELVLLARAVASLRAGNEGPVLDVLEPARASYRLAGEDLADTLDRLEGQLRKFLSDRRNRDGDEGLRARSWEALAEAAGARSARLWPAGDEAESADFVAVDGDGVPLIGAVRRRLDLGALAGLLEAALRLEPLLPALLASVAPPLRLGAPALALASAELTPAAELALRHVALAVRGYALRETSSGVELTLRGVSAAQPVALLARPQPAPRPAPFVAPAPAPEPRPAFDAAPAQPAPPDEDFDGDEGETIEAGDAVPAAGDEFNGRRRRRRRGRRGRREGGEGDSRERAPEERGDRSDRGERSESERGERAERAEAGAPAPRPFLEMSVFDLDDEESGGGESDAAPSSRRRRRRGRRSRRDGSEGVGSADDDGEPEERPRSSAEGAPRAASASTAAADAGDDDDADADALLELSEAPEIDEPEPQYEDGELEEAPLSAAERLRLERDRRRRASVAEAAPTIAQEGDDGPREAAEVEPDLPRGRAAILAHADRHSILAALLLAREVRTIEGLWIYPQSELMTFFRGVAIDLRPTTPIYVVGFEPKPSHDALQAAALYRGRLAWFDHHVWPPEDLHTLRQQIGAGRVHVTPGAESSLPSVLTLCGRRSRFTDKLVDLVNGAFTQHDWERWGRLWWHRLGEMGKRPGDHRADLEPLLAGRPSDLAREASRSAPPPLPAEAEFAASRDFPLVHFGGYGLVVVTVPPALDAALVARILRERFGAALSLARRDGSETCVLGSDESSGRALDLGSMVDHLAEKLDWVEALPGADHVARFRIRDLARRPERLDEVVAEIGMGRSILEG